MELQELFESKIILDEAQKDENILARLKFSFAKSNWLNKNDRVYPNDILSSQVKALNARLMKSKVAGQADHPLSGNTRLADVSHVLEKTWMDNDNLAWAEASILNTSKGRDVLTLLKTIPIGASMRGLGEINSSGQVQKGYKLTTVDLVENPSFGDVARISDANLIESTIIDDDQNFDILKERYRTGEKPVIWIPKSEKKDTFRDYLPREILDAPWFALAGYRGRKIK